MEDIQDLRISGVKELFYTNTIRKEILLLLGAQVLIVHPCELASIFAQIKAPISKVMDGA